jgi:uncharacterized protein (TIGR03083 family)
MEFSDYLLALRGEGEALSRAAAAGLEPEVPCCPGWTVGDVVAHTGAVHRQKEQIIREGWVDRSPPPIEAPSDGLLDWYDEGLDQLVATLAETDPATRVYTWYEPDQTVGFWYRRMAHETAVHRVDVEQGHGAAGWVVPELAADGVDELIVVMLTGYPEWSDVTEYEGTLRLEATDDDASWTLRYVTFSGISPNTGKEFADEPSFILADESEPTAVARGRASDLLLYGWGRGPVGALDVAGDMTIVADFRSVARDVT